MTAITQKQLEERLFNIKEQYSNRPDIDPEQARREMAKKEAQAYADFVIGRKTEVTGTSATGGAVTGIGEIK